MLLNAHTPDDFQIVGWLKRGIKRERNQIERRDEKGAGRRGGGCRAGAGLSGRDECRQGSEPSTWTVPDEICHFFPFHLKMTISQSITTAFFLIFFFWPSITSYTGFSFRSLRFKFRISSSKIILVKCREAVALTPLHVWLEGSLL